MAWRRGTARCRAVALPRCRARLLAEKHRVQRAHAATAWAGSNNGVLPHFALRCRMPRARTASSRATARIDDRRQRRAPRAQRRCRARCSSPIAIQRRRASTADCYGQRTGSSPARWRWGAIARRLVAKEVRGSVQVHRPSRAEAPTRRSSAQATTFRRSHPTPRRSNRGH